MKLKLVMMAVVLITSGCTIGNGHICGPQTPAAYCDREAYEELMHPKPYIDKWEKPGASPETRRQDSASCGGETVTTLRFLLLPRSRQNGSPAKRKTSHTPGFITTGNAACSQKVIGTPESATANHRQDAEHLNNTDLKGACLAAAALSSA